ncbi:efflux RND transporter permease subunit [Cytophagaceae bacterium DM2B3-1]|uniref:Efflux RND transporter permease subunit n=1 Tax=Xanthocytophaga flava TaxID=3048013 RepID=A0ABT7CDN4_9BACT|nr:efflux RND transporter permease subunit [Xanthocytophaga flavus]MDJ1491850.1 efflux RND transporter permease subunit [Xanthocytophaga flavus]
MHIAEFSVKNWQFMLVLFIAVVGLGLNSLFNMPRGEDPEFQAPSFSLVIVYPGTDPADMEELVVDPVEKRLNELENVNNIYSSIDDGLAVVTIEYKYESDPDEKYQEIVREVNALKTILPQDIFSMNILKFSPTDVSILQTALVSESASYKTLGDYADKLKERLEKVKSLKNVDDWGYPEQTVRISLNIEKMAQEGIPLNRVVQALQSENLNIPAGSVNLNTRKFNVKTSGDYSNLDEMRNTIVYTSGTKIIYLKDVANIEFNYDEEKHLTRINGKRCVLVTASQKSNENIFSVGDKINPVLESFKKELPVDIKLVKNFDQSVSVKHRLTRFAKDFLIAIVLVLITLLPLGWRASTVVMISIPLSIAMGLAALDYTGFTINQLSIVGLIVALGILVDDSIVVVENIERYLREGYGKKEAAIKATKQITFAVIGCTTTLVLAFMPLNFLPEASGDFIRSLPMAVTYTIIASLLVSLTIVPFLSSRILAQHHNPEGNFFLRILKKGISGTYSKLLHRALAHPVITLVVAGLIFGGTLMLLPTVGFSLFPKSEKPMFLINIETPEGSNIYETDRVTRYVEANLHQTPEVAYFTSNVGKGNPRIYYNVIQKGESPNFAQIFVQTEEMPVAQKVALIDQLRIKFQKYPNAKIEVKDFEQGPNQEAPIAIRVFGEDLDTMRTVAAKVESILKQTEGTIYVNNPLANRKTSLKIRINKEKAGLLGIPIVDINRTIRLAVAGLNIGVFKDEDGDDYNIVTTVPKGKYADLEVFKNLYVNSAIGTSVPLKQIADIQLETSTNLIRHYDKDRYVSVTAFLKSGYLTDNVYQQVLQKLDAMKFPEGFSYKAAGELESREKSFGGLGTIILITAFGFLGVLILEFGTFKSSIIVLSVIPLGIVGAIVMLLLTGYPMSFVAVIGLIALVGIEVKNSILLVDFTNQLRKEGMELQEAIEHAGEIRFVPIVLTSLTAIGGLIPLAIEGNPLYSPLALVLIGGLISSTLLSRIVTPIMYKLLPPKVELKNQLVVGE